MKNRKYKLNTKLEPVKGRDCQLERLARFFRAFISPALCGLFREVNMKPFAIDNGRFALANREEV